MFGAHLSIAGGLVNALEEAERLKMDCVQIFTRNQRQWKVTPIPPTQCDAWLAKLEALGWRSGRAVAHNSYLINLASPDHDVWRRSVALQRIEVERCEQLKIPYCVSHPGAHLGQARPPGELHRLGAAPGRDELAGLKRIIKALNRIHRELPGYRTKICLETTAGAGSTLGYDFRHLAFIREHVKEPRRIGFCFDTCHATAAGYDMTTDAKATKVWQQWKAICGIRSLRVFHLNDSQGAVGSRLDRHAPINQGRCGRSCFRAIVNTPAFAAVPKILETPKGTNDKGVPWDLVNIRRLRRMVRRI